MSEKRMFSKSITESDAFLDLPFPAQALYFHMSMNADDEGFINCSRRICGMCGAQDADLAKLVEKGFLIHFDTGVYVVKHWKVHNKIRADRFKSTNYPEEKSMLIEKVNGVYSLKTKDSESQKNNQKTEAEESAEIENAEIQNRENFAYEATSEPRKNYAEQIFDILFAHNLPCCNGNLIMFTIRDFKLASSILAALQLHSDEVIEAVKNYAKVIDLKRRGLTWWESEQTFYNFCEKKTILKFLPENFKIEDFTKEKPDVKGSPVEGKIQL